MTKLSFNKNFNINRVVKKLVYTILALYVGGTIVSVFGTVMNCTESPFYDGLSLIGWTVQDVQSNGSLYTCLGDTGPNLITHYNVITQVNGSGVLAVIGIIGIASVVMEFISFN